MPDARKKAWHEFPLRTAAARHLCDLCGEHIAVGERFHDGKSRGHVHQLCALQRSRDDVRPVSAYRAGTRAIVVQARGRA